MSLAADDAVLPDDPEFRLAFVAYVEWGTRLAQHNSQPSVLWAALRGASGCACECQSRADSRMTMDVYAQLEQRVKREHGVSFDRLMRQAQEIHGEQPLSEAA